MLVLMSKMQDPVPLQPPLQLVKREPGAEVAVRVTEVEPVYVCEQSLPQEIPAGELTVPLPVPVLTTFRV